MLEIRFHGRGGQGAVTSAEILALAGIKEGKYAQAMPSFGPERRGAPVAAYARISDEEILVRTGITNPDCLVVLDASLLSPALLKGLKEGGMVVANYDKDEASLRERLGGFNGPLAFVNAQRIAFDVLGVAITNTAMLGALVRATSVVSLESFDKAMHERLGRVAEKNIVAVRKAYEETHVSGK